MYYRIASQRLYSLYSLEKNLLTDLIFGHTIKHDRAMFPVLKTRTGVNMGVGVRAGCPVPGQSGPVLGSDRVVSTFERLVFDCDSALAMSHGDLITMCPPKSNAFPIRQSLYSELLLQHRRPPASWPFAYPSAFTPSNVVSSGNPMRK